MLGLGSGRASHEDHMRGDHDGTELVAQGSLGTGLAPVLLYAAWSISPSSSACSLVIQPSLTAQTGRRSSDGSSRSLSSRSLS